MEHPAHGETQNENLAVAHMVHIEMQMKIKQRGIKKCCVGPAEHHVL